MKLLNNSLSLSGKTIQSLNKLRRQLLKSSLPPKYTQLADDKNRSAKL